MRRVCLVLFLSSLLPAVCRGSSQAPAAATLTYRGTVGEKIGYDLNFTVRATNRVGEEESSIAWEGRGQLDKEIVAVGSAGELTVAYRLTGLSLKSTGGREVRPPDVPTVVCVTDRRGKLLRLDAARLWRDAELVGGPDLGLQSLLAGGWPGWPDRPLSVGDYWQESEPKSPQRPEGETAQWGGRLTELSGPGPRAVARVWSRRRFATAEEVAALSQTRHVEGEEVMSAIVEFDVGEGRIRQITGSMNVTMTSELRLDSAVGPRRFTGSLNARVSFQIARRPAAKE